LTIFWENKQPIVAWEKPSHYNCILQKSYCVTFNKTADFKIAQFSGELALLFCGKFKPATTKIEHVSTKFPKNDL
jgi:hypothetical protein